jgi:hypothetical protein
MHALLALLLTALLPNPVPGPTNPVAAASADANALGAAVTPQGSAAPYTRYLWLGGLDPKLQVDVANALAFHINGLSREQGIVRPRQVAPGLLAIDLRDYGIDPAVWDRLHDPYFLSAGVPLFTRPKGQVPELLVIIDDPDVAKTELFVDGRKIVPSAPNKPGRIVLENSARADKIFQFAVKFSSGFVTSSRVILKAGFDAQLTFTVDRDKQQFAFAQWYEGAAASLTLATRSPIPIVNALWFLNQTFIQRDRVPGYYDFLGIKNEDDLDALVGFDDKIARRTFKQAREAVAKSTVTSQPRRIDVAKTPTGPYFRTSDNRLGQFNRNPLEVLDKGFEFQARESFGHLPNGILVWGLFNNKRERQDSAPDVIAGDSFSPVNFKSVDINLACIRCHVNGVQDVKAWARSTFQGPNAFGAVEYDAFKYLRSIYLLAELEEYIDDGRAIFARAVFKANGLTPKDNAELLGKVWALYEGAGIDSHYAARDLGITHQALIDVLTRYRDTGHLLRNTFANFLASDQPIGIRQYEEFYQELQFIVRNPLP